LKQKCHHIRQLLSEYIDGALDSSKMTAVTEHLHACEDCSRRYEALKSLISSMRNITPVKAPDNFLDKIHDRIKAPSLLDKIRELLSFKRIGFPVEAAAFAATAILILFVFYFFPAEEKWIFKNHRNENIDLAMDQRGSPSQTMNNQPLSGKQVSSTSPEDQSNQQRIPIKLALLLTTPDEAVPIPSQNVSFGNSLTGNTSDDLYSWPTEKDNNTPKRLIQPDEVNQKIDEIIESMEGKVLSRENNNETGYPSHLTLDIPGINYRRFISKLDGLGALQAPAPTLPEGSQDAGVLIQMELAPPQ
jgi:hypothetical protein